MPPKTILKPGCIQWLCKCKYPGTIVQLKPTDEGYEGSCKKCGTVYVSEKEG